MICTRPFPIRPLPDDDAAVVVLDGAGDDLRRRGAAAVDEHGERDIGRDGGRAAAVDALALGLPAARRDDDGALREELAGDVDGGFEEAAGVAAQVEDERLQLALALELLDRRLHLGGRVAREPLQLDVADAIGRVADVVRVRHVFELDLGAREAEVERLRLALAVDADLDGRAGVAAEEVADLVRFEVAGRECPRCW